MGKLRFFALKEDLGMLSAQLPDTGFILDDSTSVAKQKKHFLECIRSFGAITPLDEKLSYSELASLFKKPDVIFLEVHGGRTPPLWGIIPKRTLWHSLGTLMYPHGIYKELASPFNKVSLVLTDFQRKRLEQYLKEAIAPMAVFAPMLEEKNFYLPDKKQRQRARGKLGVSNREIHIVYAGRWLVTKGICQLLRVLHLWPIKNARVTLVGDFTPGFPLQQVGASHVTFEDYFKRECVNNKQRIRVEFMKAQPPQGLREIFWSADLFVYPSLHEDENFGMTPREALLCGVPVVVTDFCGLYPLASHMPWRGINTYPTLHGARYGLRQFRDLIAQALEIKREFPYLSYDTLVKRECDPNASRANLEKAIKLLLNAHLKTPFDIQGAQKQMMVNLLRYADGRIIRAFNGVNKKYPEGALIDGMGLPFAQNEVFRVIQGMYTTLPDRPTVENGSFWRGFFPIVLWREEKKLVERGFPGPRMKYYSSREWRTLASCAKAERVNEIIFSPRRKAEIKLTQELVDLGYLVPEF
jgi:glycosyltransferase involved in cell wall biosynthesis